MKAIELFPKAIVQPFARAIGSPCYVIGLDCTYNTCTLMRCSDNEVFEKVPCTEVTGIPLSPEILKQANFEIGDDDWATYKKKGYDEHGTYDCLQSVEYDFLLHKAYINNKEEHLGTSREGKMFFLHELQLAMKDCKIEKEITL